MYYIQYFNIIFLDLKKNNGLLCDQQNMLSDTMRWNLIRCERIDEEFQVHHNADIIYCELIPVH